VLKGWKTTNKLVWNDIFKRVFAKNERCQKAEIVLNLESIGTNLTTSALEIEEIDENAQSSSVN